MSTPQQHVVSKWPLKKPFSVLLEFGESKKHISVPDYDADEPPEDLLGTLEGHLKCIDGNIRLMIDYGSHNAGETQRSGATYILQRFLREWGEFVDMIHLVEIGNGDHLKAVPLPRSLSLKDTGPQEKASTSDQVSIASCH